MTKKTADDWKVIKCVCAHLSAAIKISLIFFPFTQQFTMIKFTNQNSTKPLLMIPQKTNLQRTS